ncbi:MAG TPA: hypothetical protein VLH15_11525 [Dehalococcoidales bacterium]|nr:hypothetical protein [Dehalococcoidales bacterium]
METVILVLIGLLVTGYIVRQVARSTKKIGCPGCEEAKKGNGCPKCRANSPKNPVLKETDDFFKPAAK